MKKQLAIEFRRLLKSPTLYIAIFIGLCIAISQVVQVTLPLAKANDPDIYIENGDIPHSVFTCMMSMGRGFLSWHANMLINLAPVLVALPFGVSFYMDRRTGYIKQLFVREKKERYLWAKYIMTFVSGGFVLALPVLVNFLGNWMLVPLIEPIEGTHLFVQVPEYLEYMYYDAPVLYILCVCFIQFVMGGLMATLCLGAAYLVDVIFLVQLFPVIFVYLYNMCAGSLDFLKLRMIDDYLNIEIDAYMSALDFVKIFLVMGVFSVIYFYNGYKEETL